MENILARKDRLKTILIKKYKTLRNASMEMEIDYQKLVKSIHGYYKDEESKKIIERIEKLDGNKR